MQGIRKKHNPKAKHYHDDDNDDEMSDEEKNVGEFLCLLVVAGLVCKLFVMFMKVLTN